MKHTLSIYGSHDACAVFVDKYGKLKILEYERFVKKRYAMYSARFDHREKDLGTDQNRREQFIQYIKSQLDCKIDTILHGNLIESDIEYLRIQFPDAKFESCGHHMSHAASGYFASKFDDALICSIDGGGVDDSMLAFTKIYHGHGDKIEVIETPDICLGIPYCRIGSPISEINPGPDGNLNSLVYAGKVMGLCAYGNVRKEWIGPMQRYYEHHDIEFLGRHLGLDLSFNSLHGQDSYDLAATSQFVFESILLGVLDSYISKFDNFVLVGGCALNVLFNQRLKMILHERGKQLFVPSNPNDCGLALGQFMLKHPEAESTVYSGFDILDRDKFEQFKVLRNARKIDIPEIVDLIKGGKIIGMVNGCSEVGPRALGNRSIICDPSFKDMKDVLNAKVKFREWFRPFAPVCRLEDKERFFENTCEAEFMSYAPSVKPEYSDKLKSIRHYDGTARLQTVTRSQHEIFYDILSELNDRNETAVILNTSFNIKGKPILTTIEDALYCLDNTQMDYVIIENWLFE